jgi:hypothetical protein
MTVRELVAELLALSNQDGQVGVFCPFDGNGPKTWERPIIYQRADGSVEIDSDEGESGQGFNQDPPFRARRMIHLDDNL